MEIKANKHGVVSITTAIGTSTIEVVMGQLSTKRKIVHATGEITHCFVDDDDAAIAVAMHHLWDLVCTEAAMVETPSMRRGEFHLLRSVIVNGSITENDGGFKVTLTRFNGEHILSGIAGEWDAAFDELVHRREVLYTALLSELMPKRKYVGSSDGVVVWL